MPALGLVSIFFIKSPIVSSSLRKTSKNRKLRRFNPDQGLDRLNPNFNAGNSTLTEPDIQSGGIYGLDGSESSNLNSVKRKPAIYYNKRYSFSHIHSAIFIHPYTYSRCQNIQTENIITAGNLSNTGWKNHFSSPFCPRTKNTFFSI